ncbi:MAG: hypothetical protein BMS9Abin02_1725 [Anaerolineae bacterium]|nr:MAG: hypothetical protein BMS9Abin02_1725 [Anaerolineae bacterium]
MSHTFIEDTSQTERVKKATPDKPLLPEWMKETKEAASSSDLIYGQPVIVAMRWILVASGLLLILWNPDSLSVMRVQILVILLLALANFYLHAQLLMKRPVIDEVVYVSSAVDLILVTVLILIGNGFESRLLVYYFPAIVSFSVVFPTVLTGTYVGSTIAVYGLIGLISGGDPMIILTRLLIIAAVGTCGNLYLRIERSRRKEARESQEHLMVQIRERQASTAQ